MRCWQIFAVSALAAVALAGCGSPAARHHFSAEPVSPSLARGTLIPGKVMAWDWVSAHQGWMMTDNLVRRMGVNAVTLYHTIDQGIRWQVVARY